MCIPIALLLQVSMHRLGAVLQFDRIITIELNDLDGVWFSLKKTTHPCCLNIFAAIAYQEPAEDFDRRGIVLYHRGCSTYRISRLVKLHHTESLAFWEIDELECGLKDDAKCSLTTYDDPVEISTT